ncbi:MAG: site-specific recombinase [Bacillota bacterium]|nr:MAG: site-specific recombinase [Bacillota bacterium]
MASYVQEKGSGMKPARAVAYVRVSTAEQTSEGVSLDGQEERLRAYFTLQGLELVEQIREAGVSASKPLAERPGGKRLLELVGGRWVQHLVALKRDRLFRDAEDALRQTKARDRAGVALHRVDVGGQAVNTATAMGRFFLSMTAAFAELKRSLIAERTQATLSRKKADRKAYAPTPYGFDRDGEVLVENPAEQRVLMMVRTWCAQGWSLRRIAEELNRRRIPSKKGGRWHASTVRYTPKNDLYG